jgi:hypothetical protein
MRVFVLDKNRKPLDPCCAARARARELLGKGRAAIFRMRPFTIILKDRTTEESVVHEHRLKIDPGSKTTGMVVLQEQTGNGAASAPTAGKGMCRSRSSTFIPGVGAAPAGRAI